MRARHALASASRRPATWAVVAVCVLLGAVVGHALTDPSYRSEASVLIVPAGTDPESDDAPADLDDGAAQLALIVSNQLQTPGVRDQVVTSGAADYTTVSSSVDDREVAVLTPLVRLTVSASSPRRAEEAMGTLLQQARAQLAAVQASSGIPVDDRAQAVTSSPRSAAVAVGRPKLRGAAVFGLLAGALGFLTVALIPVGRRETAQTTPSPVLRPTHPMITPHDPLDVFEAPGPAASPIAEVRDRSAASRKQHDEAVRRLVQEEWERSGRNVAWSRSERKAAFVRAEQRLTDLELAGADDLDS